MSSTIRPLIMSVTEQRSQAPELLDQLNDEFFSAVYALLETYVRQQQEPIVGYTTKGEAVTARQFVAEADAAVDAAKAGKSITIQELEKRSEEWLSRLQ